MDKDNYINTKYQQYNKDKLIFATNKDIIEKCIITDFDTTLRKKGYTYFTKGDYNLNLIGIRSNADRFGIKNAFNDAFVVEYKVNDKWQSKIYPCTTDPGIYYLKEKLLSSKGCAILKPNQYRSTFKLGLHQGKYKALVQSKPVTVYRDNNKDDKLDYVNPETGMFGINIHKAGEESKHVDKWSAGCQVLAIRKNFDELIELCEISSKLYGNSFTYTLIEEEDLILYE